MDTLAGEHFHHWHCQMPSHAAAAPPRWGHLHCARCNCQAKTEQRALPWAAPTSVARLQPGSTPKQPRSWLFRALQPCENGHRTGWGLLSKHRYWERQEPRCVSHRSIPANIQTCTCAAKLNSIFLQLRPALAKAVTMQRAGRVVWASPACAGWSRSQQSWCGSEARCEMGW